MSLPRVASLTLLLLLTVAGTPRAQQPGATSDSVDAVIATAMRNQRIPGLSLAVVRNGTIIKTRGYGLADRERDVPATPETVYKMASVSKLIIATRIMALMQEGRLRLDDSIVRHLEGAPASWNPITIRHLLSHTSGLGREGPAFNPLRRQPDAEVIASAYPVPLRFAPGERYEYSNLGYFILAELIHRASGQPWDEYLAATMFRPLGMTSTRTTAESASLPNRAVGYQDNNRLVPAVEWPALRPSGAFVSTVLDLAKWDAALYTTQLLNDSTRQQMWEAVPLANGAPSNYSLGWRLGAVEGQRMVYHPGGMLGFRAGFARFPESGLTVIILTNLDDSDMETLLRGVAEVYLPSDGGPAVRR